MGLAKVGQPPVCKDTAYDIAKSTTVKRLENSYTQVTYGSAHLSGQMVTEVTCLNPVNISKSASKDERRKALKDDWCFNMNLIALEQAQGLHNATNGILGLSPKKDPRKNKEHILWAM